MCVYFPPDQCALTSTMMICRKTEDILHLSILIFFDCCNRLPLIFGVPLSQQSVQLFAIFFKQLIKFLFAVFSSALLYFSV